MPQLSVAAGWEGHVLLFCPHSRGGGGLEYQWSGELGLGREEADSWLLKLAVVDGHMDPELAWANSTLCGTACLLELSGSLDQGAYDPCAHTFLGTCGEAGAKGREVVLSPWCQRTHFYNKPRVPSTDLTR